MNTRDVSKKGSLGARGLPRGGKKGNLDWLYWCPLSRSLEVYLSNRVGSILNNLASGTAGRKALDIT
jgi:hypothetical protein